MCADVNNGQVDKRRWAGGGAHTGTLILHKSPTLYIFRDLCDIFTFAILGL